jgi:hypothetical protein
MWLKRLRLFLSIILASIGLITPVEAAGFANLGENLEEANQTNFFRFFNLEQTQAARIGGNTVTSFKPSGAKFRPLVTVKVTTDAEGRIQAVEMVVLRSFIDDPQNGLFARDIAKSFLLVGLPSPRDRETTDLINEIQYQGTSTMTIIKRKVDEPKLPEKPTSGYLTYLGRQPNYEHHLRGYLLRLENGAVEGGAALVFSIRSRS